MIDIILIFLIAIILTQTALLIKEKRKSKHKRQEVIKIETKRLNFVKLRSVKRVSFNENIAGKEDYIKQLMLRDIVDECLKTNMFKVKTQDLRHYGEYAQEIELTLYVGDINNLK